MKRILLLILFTLPLFLFSEIIEIKQDGTGDFTTIQEGIDTSQNNDHILIYPGRYFENLNTNGKNITLSSLEMTTGNPAYIDSTIIDGNNISSCILVDNEESVVIRGLSITRGSGAGEFKRGGGIFINYHSTANIINCRIFNNKGLGGGVNCRASSVYFEGTIITNNYSARGGGIMFEGNCDDIEFSPTNRCSIYNNFAGDGIDIVLSGWNEFYNVEIFLDKFTILEPTTYFANYDFVFTDDYPFIFHINEGVMETINHDFYVSPDGDDTNSGLSVDDPLKTIALAMNYIASDSLNPKTIYLAPGIYSKEANNQHLPISAKNFVNIIGENHENTIISGEGNSFFSSFMAIHKKQTILRNITFENLVRENVNVLFIYKSSELQFENIIIQNSHGSNYTALLSERGKNLIFRNVKVLNNIADEYTAGITLLGVDGVLFENCLFENNWAKSINCILGSMSLLGIGSKGKSTVRNSIFRYNRNDCFDANGSFVLGSHQGATIDEYNLVENCLVYENYTTNTGFSGISYIGSYQGRCADIRNCTIYDNYGSTYALGGGGVVNVYNNILFNDTDYEVASVNTIAEVNVSYNNIKNGREGCLEHLGVINYLEGNIEDEPILNIGGDLPFSPSQLSPCINAGTPDTIGLNLPEYDLAGNPRIADGRIDMGCYEYQPNPEYGDVDDNNIVQAYDASVVLQYSVGLDPIPEIDPIPWEESRITSADVDGNEEIEAYDASLILQYAVGLINQFPVQYGRNEIPFSTIDISIEENELVFKADKNLYSLMIEDNSNLLNFGKFETKMLFARNGNKFAFCSAISQRGEFLRIPFTLNEKINKSKIGEDLIFSLSVNSIKEDYRISIDELIRNYQEIGKLPDYYISVAPNPISLSSNTRNNSTKILYTIAENGRAFLDIYNIKGQKIKTLLNTLICPSINESHWNLKNDSGNTISSGQYFLRLEQNGNVRTKKFMVVK